MRASWLEAPATVREVMEHLHGHGRAVAHSAVQPVPGLAEQKGSVRSDRSKLAYVCHATSFRERFRLARLKSLLVQLYDGATGPVALQLVRSSQLTPKEHVELRQLIDRLGTHRG